MYKRIIALFSCFVILFSCVPFAHAEYTSDNQGANFWDWVMIYGNKYGSGTSISGVVQAVTGWMSGKVCSLSPDSYHHSDVKPNAFGNGGRDDSGSYVWCTCKYCGDQFKLYTSIDTDHGGGFGKSDLQQSYEAQVEELPAQGISSAGKLIWQPTVNNIDYSKFSVVSVVANSTIFINELPYFHSTGPSSFISYSSNSDGTGLVFTSSYSTSIFNANSTCYLIVPISGSYKVNSITCSYDIVLKDGSRLKDVQSSASGAYAHYSEAAQLRLWSSFLNLTNGQEYSYGTATVLFPVIEIIPDSSVGGSTGDIYNINSRPTSITGDYGIIGDNGQIVKVEGDKIVNETNNTYYNPSTGETTTITDWSYNYEDRSYTVTTESGDTVTITYGNENVTIKEGDTTYNVYYLVSGSGSEDPGPDVPPACNHQWTETSTTPATCTVPGSRLLTCSLCNETKTETIPAPGHKWTIKQEVKNEYDENGNQTQEGYTIWECSVCGEQQKTTDGTAPPGGGSGTGSGSSGGVFSGIFGLLVDFLGFFWNTFRDFVGEGVKGFLNALMDGTSSIFGLLNPFNWGG